MAVKTKNFKCGKVGILMGGPSTEREVSLKSGKSVYESLKQSGKDCVCIDITSDDICENVKLIKSFGIDCAFLALHGRFGEDGAIQEILDHLRIPYTGSSTLASKLAMDKIISRRILQVHGLDVPKYKVIEKINYNNNMRWLKDFAFPLVIKPASHGSSIGLSIIDSESLFPAAIEAAFVYDNTVLVEQFIEGREITVGILDNKPLPVVEIIPKSRFFDFEAKYHSGSTEYIVPARLDGNIARKAQAAALKTHMFLGCFGCSRVDIILSKDNTPFILELNSIPGLTPTSLLPKAARAVGIEFHELVLKLIKLAYEKAENKVSY